MLGGVLVLRRITAAHVAAAKTKPKMDPSVAHLQTFFAALGVGMSVFCFLQMTTGC